ncbi:MAG: hypothetical protein OEW84_08855 [Aigarchaeota archaeon]|nr:hypothetical protein [Aigarchaeota archaeon]
MVGLAYLAFLGWLDQFLPDEPIDPPAIMARPIVVVIVIAVMIILIILAYILLK